MKSKKYFPHIIAAAAGLILLGLLGVYWPSLVGADSTESALVPQATIGDAITYQGYLTDNNDNPLNGTYTMRFRIYNAQSGGTLLWDSGNTNISVKDGLFETRLGITTDIFNGEELWVAQTVDGELLTPRQEILPAPMAHTLRPGAVVKATASAFANNYAVEVNMNNDVFGFNRGAIAGQTTTGNAVYGLADNGRAIYGQTRDGFAVYGFDGGSDANKGYAGYFYSTNGIGVYGYSGADRTHPNILAPGVYGQSNQGVGVYGRGDTSDSHSFYNEGGRFEGGSGISARGTDSNGYGGEMYSANYRGLFATSDAGFYDGYFGAGAGISASNVVDRSGRTQSLVVNLGSTTIEKGDLVAMVGIATNPENGEPMLGVAKLNVDNRNAVIGVAQEAISAETVDLDDGTEYVDFGRTTDAITPNSHLVIITNGLAAAVNVSSLDRVTGGEIGSKIALSATSELALARDVVDGIVVGKVAGPIDTVNGTIPLFIDID